MYPIKPPYNQGKSAQYLKNMLGENGGENAGESNTGVFLSKSTDFKEDFTQHTVEINKFIQYSEVERLDLLYDYMVERSDDNTFVAGSDRDFTKEFVDNAGLQVDRKTLRLYINKLIDKRWITEVNEIDKKYILVKP